VTTIEERFGRRLRRIRKLVGDSSQRLADVCGVDVSQVPRWEKGEASPRGSAMLLLLQHYREHQHYLIHGEPGEEPAPSEHVEVLRAFLRTAIGQLAASAGIVPALSSIQFTNTPSVQLYSVIALELMRDSEHDS